MEFQGFCTSFFVVSETSFSFHTKQQRVTDLQSIVGIVSKDSSLEINRKQFLFVGPHSASSWTSARQTLHLANSVMTSCVGLALLSLI